MQAHDGPGQGTGKTENSFFPRKTGKTFSPPLERQMPTSKMNCLVTLLMAPLGQNIDFSVLKQKIVLRHFGRTPRTKPIKRQKRVDAVINNYQAPSRFCLLIGFVRGVLTERLQDRKKTWAILSFFFLPP